MLSIRTLSTQTACRGAKAFLSTLSHLTNPLKPASSLCTPLCPAAFDVLLSGVLLRQRTLWSLCNTFVRLFAVADAQLEPQL